MRRVSFLAVAVAGALAAPATVPAQQGRTAPVLLEPLDWGPNAAWRRRAAQVRTERMQLLRQGDLERLNAVAGRTGGGPLRVLGALPQTAVTGAFHVPVIVIGYRDRPVQYSTAAFQCLLFSRNPTGCGNPGDRPYSVTTYYEELSHHRISLDGVVLPPARMDSNAAFYTDGCNGFTISGRTPCPSRPANRMALMLVAALDSVSQRPGGDTLWSQFDNDGPDGVPNSGDDDGVVDFVGFLQPEVGGECVRLDPPPTGIWSHRFVISGWMGGVSPGARPASIGPDGMYITRTPRRGPNGQQLVINGVPQFLKVNDYTIQSQLGGATACDAGAIMGIGTIAHETGHAFGLPDLYDTSGGTQGIGGWGLMGAGNYARPYSPSSYDAWSLLVLGWTTVDTLGSSRVVTTGPRLLTDTIFYARTDNPDDFLLIENRQAVLSDTAQMNPTLPDGCPPPPGSTISGLGFCAKSPGLLLWLVNQPKVSASLFSNSVNTGFTHGVALLQADGLNQLRLPGSNNRGDRGDPFPGSTGNTRFSLQAAPSARSNTGDFIGFIVDQIATLPGGSLRFRFTRRRPSLIATDGGAQIRVNGVAWTRYEDVIPAGDPIQLGADEVQLLAGGKTRSRFLAWSNGGPREQTLASNPVRPDTLTALFTTEHRLLVTATAGGTVSADPAANLSQGVFFSQGSPVRLSAAPAPGFLFAGWRGDTVATTPVLELTLGKGYDLEARFVPIVTVTLQDALGAILGGTTLSIDQRSFLDELGNRNGVYDVGDLLALYLRQGLAAPAALRASSGAPNRGETPLPRRRPPG
jgi:M6 family metalloprotease-like protein